MPPRQLSLVPALVEPGHLNDFLDSGQTTSFTLSPRSNSFALFATPSERPSNGASTGNCLIEQDIYTAVLNEPPIGERRTFVTDTSVIFAAGLNFAREIKMSDENNLIRSPENIVAFRKLANDYILHVQDCWIHSITMSSRDYGPRYTGDHYRSLYSTFSLFQILYLPEDGIEDVPVGDELLDWLNTHFIEPSTEEGDRLNNLERPWEDDVFWAYLIRATLRGLLKSSTFFLRSLLNHPSENLQRIADKLIEVLDKHPRQRNFNTEKEFYTASRRWGEKVKIMRIELDRVPENDRSDGFENWWENLSDLLGILEGRKEVIQRLCVDLGGTWKEIVSVYGVWVDVGLRRSELPDIVGRTLCNLPADPTDKEDALHLEFAQGRIVQALALAYEIDPWLSAHLVDIMASTGLLNAEADDETGVSIRDHYVLAYADYLYSDPGLWRLTVDYLCTCGEVGMERADEVLLRVPLRMNGTACSNDEVREGNQSVSMQVEEETQDHSGDLSAVVKELNMTCYEYQREHTRRLICQIVARRLIKLGKYGLAVSYCRSAEDWTMLGYIVETVMEEYIAHGPSHYVARVAEIAPSLEELRSEPGPHGIFVHRLVFAVRYADFHQRKMLDDTENAALDLVSMFEEEIAPRAWWGVLLYDAIPFLQDEQELVISSSAACLLLRRLEEVTLRADQGCGEDYLGILARVLSLSGPKEALRRLDVLRLALARYLARCTLAGTLIADAPSTHEFLNL